MSKTLRPASLLALGLLAGCGGAPEPTVGPDPSPTAATRAPASNAFEVHVSLSDLAASQLPAAGEPLVVRAEYFGYPTVAAQQRQLPRTEHPWLALGEREVRLAGAGVARFPDVAFDADDLALVEGGAPQVSITLRFDAGVAADEAAEDLLDCGMFQDALAVAGQAPIEVDCKLLAE